MSIRGRGLILALAGSGVTVAIVWLLRIWLTRIEHGFGIILFAGVVPAIIALVGFWELMTGLPFETLATRWQRLEAWQRGVVGLLALGVFLLVCKVIVDLFIKPGW